MSNPARTSQNELQPNRLPALYMCCKTILVTFLTALLLVPVLFMVASEDNHFYQKPFYSLLAHNNHLTSFSNQITAQIGGTDPGRTINLFSLDPNKSRPATVTQKQSLKRWQNLKELGEYLGYQLNAQGKLTVSRHINYPSKNISSTPSKEAVKQLTKKAYNLDSPSNVALYLKKKLTKMLTNIIRRLQWKAENNPSLLGFLKNYIISLVQEQQVRRVWIIVLSPENEEYHHPATFQRKLSEWRESHKSDELIIISRLPVDVTDKVTGIEFNIEKDDIISELIKIVPQEDQLQLPFRVHNPALVYAYLIEKHDGSLSKLSKFIQACHQNILCSHAYHFLRDHILHRFQIDDRGTSCPIHENYINNLNDQQFDEYFRELINNLGTNDIKQLKKNLNTCLGIIRVDLCGRQLLGLQANPTDQQEQPNKTQRDQPAKKNQKQKKKQTEERKQKQAQERRKKQAEERRDRKTEKKQKQVDKKDKQDKQDKQADRKKKRQQSKTDRPKTQSKPKTSIPKIPKEKSQSDASNESKDIQKTDKTQKTKSNKKKFEEKVEAAKKRQLQRLEEQKKQTPAEQPQQPLAIVEAVPSAEETTPQGSQQNASLAESEDILVTTNQQSAQTETLQIVQDEATRASNLTEVQAVSDSIQDDQATKSTVVAVSERIEVEKVPEGSELEQVAEKIQAETVPQGVQVEAESQKLGSTPELPGTHQIEEANRKEETQGIGQDESVPKSEEAEAESYPDKQEATDPQGAQTTF